MTPHKYLDDEGQEDVPRERVVDDVARRDLHQREGQEPAAHVAPALQDDRRRSNQQRPARSVAVSRLGPNGLKIDKEATHVIVRWTRVASMA